MKKYIITLSVLLFALFVVSPMMPANAISSTSSEKSYSSYSVEELESLITKLQKQLEEMKKGSQCFVSDKNLSIGDGEDEESKSEVVRLQEFLREKGYFNVKKSTGYFGKITRAAMINFQKDSGIEQTGELNSETREKIKSLRCKITNIKKEIKTSAEEKKKQELKSQEVKSAVSKISLSADGKTVSWKTDGYSKSGFKIVWSKNTNPTYPNRDGDKYIYLSDSSASSTILEGFDGEGMYYARVCEYLGGKCGVYSNEISLNL